MREKRGRAEERGRVTVTLPRVGTSRWVEALTHPTAGTPILCHCRRVQITAIVNLCHDLFRNRDPGSRIRFTVSPTLVVLVPQTLRACGRCSPPHRLHRPHISGGGHSLTKGLHSILKLLVGDVGAAPRRWPWWGRWLGRPPSPFRVDCVEKIPGASQSIRIGRHGETEFSSEPSV